MRRDQLLSIHRNRCSTFELDLDLLPCPALSPAKSSTATSTPPAHSQDLPVPALMAQVPQISIAAVNVLAARSDRNVARLRVIDGILARLDLHSRHGAMIFNSGASAWTACSKRTWSLPLPVHPCATASAPFFNANSTCRFAQITDSRTTFPADTCARTPHPRSAPGHTYSRHELFAQILDVRLELAPVAIAFFFDCFHVSPCPTSPIMAITSQP